MDDLRGRWEIHWIMEDSSGDEEPGLIALIQDIQEVDGAPGSYLVNGCLFSAESGETAPLALVIVRHQDGVHLRSPRQYINLLTDLIQTSCEHIPGR